LEKKEKQYESKQKKASAERQTRCIQATMKKHERKKKTFISYDLGGNRSLGDKI